MDIHMTVVLGDTAVDIWPLGVAVLVVLLFILWRKKHSLSYLLCCAVFGIYLLFALDKTFFPLMISGNYADTMRQQSLKTYVNDFLLSYINLVPFYFGPYGTLQTSFLTTLLNVALTIPFGFGVNFVAQIRAKNMLWLAPAVGFTVEFAQLIMSLILRYPYRVIDINDVIMNALGVWVGYGIFRIFAWLYIRATRRFAIKQWGLHAYIYAVASRVQ